MGSSDGEVVSDRVSPSVSRSDHFVWSKERRQSVQEGCGRVGGCRRCVLIKGGCGNKASNLSLVVDESSGVGVEVAKSRLNFIKNVKILGGVRVWELLFVIAT